LAPLTEKMPDFRVVWTNWIMSTICRCSSSPVNAMLVSMPPGAELYAEQAQIVKGSVGALERITTSDYISIGDKNQVCFDIGQRYNL